MSSDFIIVPKKQAKPIDISPTGLANSWFDSIRGVPSETLMRLQEKVHHKLESGACRHLLPKLPTERLAGVELTRCVESVITEQWDLLTPEERLLIRFPTVQAVGEYFDIPNRGQGLIIKQELTRRFGIETIFQLQDGSFFKWEFID